MNKEQMQKQLNELKTKVSELEKAIQEEEKEWIPKRGDDYFNIDTIGTVCEDIWYDDEDNAFAFDKRNYYKTEEEANFALDMYKFCKERSFIYDWEDDSQKTFFLVLDYKTKEAWIDTRFNCDGFAPFYYPTKKAVQEVIDKYTFGELAKYYGRV